MHHESDKIVVLTDEYSAYQKVLVDAIGDVMNHAGYGVLCLAGRELEPLQQFQRNYAVCNSIFELIDDTEVAGAVFLSGTLGHSVGHRTLSDFLQRFSLPMVSIGVDIAGVPSVIVDDIQAMTLLMEQLVSDPDRQHFAFIQGHSRDRYSLQRETIFRKVLATHGREVDERCIVEGKFDAGVAYDAAKQLLLAFPSIDTIVAANDVTALSAARAVTASGRRIPADVAVTGFDDTSEATRSVPALTTVRQPTLEMAELGAMSLLKQLDGSASSEVDTPLQQHAPLQVVSELIIRGSTQVINSEIHPATSPHERDMTSLLSESMASLPPPDDQILVEISDALIHTLKYSSAQLDSCIRKVLSERMHLDHVHWWSNACHQLLVHGEQELKLMGHLPRLPLIELPIARMRERIWALNMEQQFAASRLQQQLADVQLQMGACSDFEGIAATLARWTENIKPRRCFLARYNAPARQPAETSILLQAFRRGVLETVDHQPFKTASILPLHLEHELDVGTLILNPVYAGNKQYGYLLVDPEGLQLLSLDDLAHCIGTAMRNQFLISSLEIQTRNLTHSNSDLSRLANRDTLTGLSNRHHFQQRLQAICTSAIETGERFVLMFLDLDGFKPVNDSLGHDAGDEVLKRVARRLEQVVRIQRDPQDLIARLGGDEFTVILRSCDDPDSVNIISQALLDTLAAPYDINGEIVSISASIGAAIFPDHATEAETLLKRADDAMYEAKASGRNAMVCSSDDTEAAEVPPMTTRQ